VKLFMNNKILYFLVCLLIHSSIFAIYRLGNMGYLVSKIPAPSPETFGIRSHLLPNCNCNDLMSARHSLIKALSHYCVSY
jgi:hypothetical protein